MEEENIIKQFDEFNPAKFNKIFKDLCCDYNITGNIYLRNAIIFRLCYDLITRKFGLKTQTYFICG